MKIDYPSWVMEEFMIYKAVYQKYMGLSDDEMHSDDVLLVNAFRGEVRAMLDEMEKWKR